MAPKKDEGETDTILKQVGLRHDETADEGEDPGETETILRQIGAHEDSSDKGS